MSKILVILSSPNPKEKAHSDAMVDRFLKHYLAIEANKNDQIEWLDLNEDKNMKDVISRSTKATYFANSDQYINQLKNVDKVIVATSMQNFNVPALLKIYIDHIMVADKTFSYKYKEKGQSIGLLKHLKVQILGAQGAPEDWYPFGLFGKYLEGAFGFIGAKINKTVIMDGMNTAAYKEKPLNEIIDEFDGALKDAARRF